MFFVHSRKEGMHFNFGMFTPVAATQAQVTIMLLRYNLTVMSCILSLYGMCSTFCTLSMESE